MRYAPAFAGVLLLGAFPCRAGLQAGERRDTASSPYLKRLEFRDGDPVVSVRLMEGREEIRFSGSQPIRIFTAQGSSEVIELEAGTVWTVRVTSGEPAVVSASLQLAEIAFSQKAALAAEQKAWKDRGIAVRVRTIGSLYGIKGKVIDNRRYLVLLDEKLEPEARTQREAQLLRRYGVHAYVLEELSQPSHASFELVDAEGKVVATAQDRLAVELLQPGTISVRWVEFGVGYPFHGFEDRSYRGSVEFVADQKGKLAVVNVVSLEDLLKGLVPAEIFARAPMEALKAQAVTARGEVLAKIGTKHLADPYLLCSEQHCAVYKGVAGEADSASLAVDATRGEALFAHDRLVDSVYSAVCGGHTENNEAVWGGLPNPNLRGRPDLIVPRSSAPSPHNLEAFLTGNIPAACHLASMAQPGKFRWERRFSSEQLDQLTLDLGVGSVKAISVLQRGVSGRARAIRIVGDRGDALVRGELNIRRLFGMLNSALFTVRGERLSDGTIGGWSFRGAGWGHGVGMCQMGAIGRAERGQDYRAILRHYFSGAEVTRIY
jgi:SpoIID/LytB domain protein